jgi:hypothetical protein
MNKMEFLGKWAKAASGQKSVELFERDLESLLATTIRSSTSGIARGLRNASAKSKSPVASRVLMDVADIVLPAVESALMKVNGIEEEEGEGHASSDPKGPAHR